MERSSSPVEKKRYPQASHYVYLGDAQRGYQADIGGVQAPAFAQYQVSDCDVLTGLAHVIALAGAAVDADAAPGGLDVLLDDDGVGALRHDRPGHDANAGAGGDSARERLAGPGRAQNVQLGRAVGGDVRAVHRVAVHGRVGAGRHVDTGTDVCRQDPVQGLPNGDFFGAADAADTGLYLLQRGIGRQ